MCPPVQCITLHITGHLGAIWGLFEALSTEVCPRCNDSIGPPWLYMCQSGLVFCCSVGVLLLHHTRLVVDLFAAQGACSLLGTCLLC